MTDLSGDLSSTLMAAASDVMTIDGVMVGETRPFRQAAPVPGRAARAAAGSNLEESLLSRALVRLRGQLLVPADEAYRRLAERLHALDLTPALRRGSSKDETVLLALPGAITQARPNVRLAVALFVATALSCLFVGAQMTEAAAASGNLNWNLLDGWPYAVSLLAILLSHEFGHYLTARRLGAPVSLPYFIPFPIGLGTMGAVINMPAPPRNRRQLLAVGAAGPLAGLLVAIPILWLGLTLSKVQPLPLHGYQLEGNSLLYALMKYLRFGQWLPGHGLDVMIGQVATAGWVGLLVTSLNLMPAGQLDGGHIVYSLVGSKWAERINWIVLAAAVGLIFLSPVNWAVWAVLIFLVSRLPHIVLDDITTLTTAQRVLAVCMFLVFILVFIPIPWTVVP